MSQAVNARLDQQSAQALERLKANGRSTTEAVRFALIETAARQDAADWEQRARELAADPADRAEVAEVRELMDSLRPGTL